MDNTHIPAAQMVVDSSDKEEDETDNSANIQEEKAQSNIILNKNNINQNEDNNSDNFIAALFVISAIFLIYFLPTVVANMRNHDNTLSIFVLNLFLGWTFLGWVLALIWSCYNTKK